MVVIMKKSFSNPSGEYKLSTIDAIFTSFFSYNYVLYRFNYTADIINPEFNSLALDQMLLENTYKVGLNRPDLESSGICSKFFSVLD